MWIDPLRHSIAYAELLNYKFTCGEVKDIGLAVEQCRALFLQMPPADVLTCSKTVTAIARQLVHAVLTTEQWIKALGALKAIVEKISSELKLCHCERKRRNGAAEMDCD